jgi:hypothetical protein
MVPVADEHAFEVETEVFIGDAAPNAEPPKGTDGGRATRSSFFPLQAVAQFCPFAARNEVEL